MSFYFKRTVSLTLQSREQARSGSNDNPTLKQWLVNDGALRLQNPHALDLWEAIAYRKDVSLVIL